MSSLSRWFRIEEEERPLVAAISGSGFFFAAATTVTWTLLIAFVVKRAGVENLPHLFLIDAIALLAASLFSIRAFRYIRTTRQILFFTTFSAIASLSLALLQQSGLATGRIGVLLLATLGAILVSGGTGMVIDKLRAMEADAFGLEQLTRLDPILTSSLTFGTAFGGALLAVFGRVLPAQHLFFLAPVLVLGGSAFCIRTARLFSSMERPFAPEFETAVASRPIDDASIRFITMLAVLTGMSAAFSRLFQFTFAASTNQHFPDEASLNAFIGSYMVVLSIAGAVLSNTVHRLTLKRFGLSNALFSVPALITIGVVTMAIDPTMVVVVGAIFLRDSFIPLQDIATRGMLAGMRDDRRASALTWLDGPVTVIGGISGAMLTAVLAWTTADLGTTTTIRTFAVAILFLIIIRFAVNFAVRRRYPDMLLESLRNSDYKTRVRAMEVLAEFRFLRDRRLSVVLDVLSDEAEPPALRAQSLRTLAVVKDHSTLRVIGKFLNHADPVIRLEAVRTVASFNYPPEDLYESGFSRRSLITGLRETFANEKIPEITNAVLAALIALRDPDIADFLADALQSEQSHVRHAVLRSLRAFSDSSIIDQVKPFLNDPSPFIRAQAIAALWRFPWEHRGPVSAQLELLLAAPINSEEFRQGVYLLGVLALHDRKEIAIKALKASNPVTRRVAAIALLRQGDESGIQTLSEALRHGTAEEAYQVERLVTHQEIPPVQRRRLQDLVHQHHLHYPSALPVSEPLGVRISSIPKECLAELREHYASSPDRVELRKIESAFENAASAVRGSVYLAGLPPHWQKMAAVILLAHGWRVRSGNSALAAYPGERIIGMENASEHADVTLTANTEGLSPTQVVMSHFAPSALLHALDNTPRK